MIGTARSTAAVTIVNALPTGVGCALGIGIPVRARVVLRKAAVGTEPSMRLSRGAGTPVIRETLRLAIDQYAPGGPWSADVELRSEIPPARGLKSSSAVASAVARATARAAGRDPSPLEIARLAAGAGRTAGVSATGALDDALAGLQAGFCVTNNRTGELLYSAPADPSWRVALLIPSSKHRPSPEWRGAFEVRAPDGQRAVDAALSGDWWTAMTRNTELVEQTMHYEYGRLRTELIGQGAFAAGVSGLGPTLAAVAPAEHAADVLAGLPKSLGERRLVAVSSDRDSEVPR